VLFGAFAGYTYWFPKAFGFVLDERLGKAAFWCWLVGFYVAFVPLYIVGLEGMTRRMQHYDRPEWYPWILVAGVGALIILCGIALQIAQLWVSIRGRERRREATGDPWDGRSLEWSTSSPPPAFNFAVLPQVTDDDPYWATKQRTPAIGHPATAEPKYSPIEMPRNSATGFVTAFFAVVTGFSLIWQIWWLVILGLIGAYVTFVVFAWRDIHETEIPAEEVARIDRANRAARAAALHEEPAR
jgi:cytochrome o ubiquinol oxidase subunit I